ncbi:SPOR domain-containing protein [Roseateles sp. DAIF2]|uniref:SPOR domain-containing protein n=1 Tax=Roseateles sp. DAIF2 TaxID=2714952 RepID=UPI0018A29A21|nr:SPOR domain-containing protein [Roseateles sp. DAIF2]QPF76009.1 SPOR domain-containing protein [Roseateles sp. DAIF2]
MSKAQASQRGGFVLGLIIGLLLGLGVALGVALYITKVPIPFVNKVPQRTAEQDAEEAARNRNWDPNAALGGSRPSAKAASGVVGGTAPAPEPQQPAAPAVTPAAPTAAKPAASAPVATAAASKPAGTTAPAGADPYVYFVQVGAYTRTEDAEAQRAKLAMQGFGAKIFEREQSGRTVFRVRMGPLDGRDEAEALQRKVEAAGMEANLVRVQR